MPYRSSAAFALACFALPALARALPPDSTLQGEYAGSLRIGGAPASEYAAQVVVRGTDGYLAVFYPGGLPGAGWTGSGRVEVEGAREAGLLRFAGGGHAATLDADSLRGTVPGGGAFSLAKRVRVSPTLGLAPPANAVILYDGSSLAAWSNADKDSLGLFAPREREAATHASFSDFSLHVEFRLPFLPDQAWMSRANSGLRFLSGNTMTAEIQILDSFGGEPGSEFCGGLESRFAPWVSAALPPLAWQTFDVRYAAPDSADLDSAGFGIGTMTVWHNGILIHHARPTDYSGPAVRLALQNLDSPGGFRNIWLVDGDAGYPFPGLSARPRKPAGKAKAPGHALRGPRGPVRADGRAVGTPTYR